MELDPLTPPLSPTARGSRSASAAPSSTNAAPTSPPQRRRKLLHQQPQLEFAEFEERPLGPGAQLECRSERDRRRCLAVEIDEGTPRPLRMRFQRRRQQRDLDSHRGGACEWILVAQFLALED